MSAITVEFSDSLAQQIDEQRISNDQLQTAILEFIRLYVRAHAKRIAENKTNTDGAEFARRIFSDNRQLFEELARL